MATPQLQKRLLKKKKSPKKFRLSYSLLLLLAMIVVGTVSGLAAYKFGKQALEGVKTSPVGIKLPKFSPVSKPKDSTKSSPQSQADGKTSFLLDEAAVIAEMKSQSQQELGGLTRPTPVAKTNISDRKSIYSKTDQAYNSISDPLVGSMNADERIAARIAALRQRVYSSTRSYDNFDRLANAATSSPSLISTPVELTPIRNRWEDRDAADLVVNPKKLTGEVIEIAPQPKNSFFTSDQQRPSTVEVNRR